MRVSFEHDAALRVMRVWARGAMLACIPALAAGCALLAAQEPGPRERPLAGTVATQPEARPEPQADDDAIAEEELKALAALSPAAGAAQPPTSPQSAARFVQRLGGDAIAMMSNPSLEPRERAQALRALLMRGFDTDTMSRIVLGRYWRKATPAQRAEYRQLFPDFIVAIYAARFSKYSGETLTITGARPHQRRIVIVKSLVRRPGKAPVHVDWLVRYSTAGHGIIDVVVEGVSMAITQRSEFAAIIQNHGGDIDGLLAALRARVT